MSTVADILAEARAVIVALDTSRGPAGRKFTQHPRELGFTMRPGPVSADTFHVEAASQQTTGAFGRTGTKMDVVQMRVLLGHGPNAGRESDRENFVASDVEKIRDIIEMRVWTATVDGCFYENDQTDRSNRDWWVTTIVFRVTYTAAIITS